MCDRRYILLLNIVQSFNQKRTENKDGLRQKWEWASTTGMKQRCTSAVYSIICKSVTVVIHHTHTNTLSEMQSIERGHQCTRDDDEYPKISKCNAHQKLSNSYWIHFVWMYCNRSSQSGMVNGEQRHGWNFRKRKQPILASNDHTSEAKKANTQKQPTTAKRQHIVWTAWITHAHILARYTLYASCMYSSGNAIFRCIHTKANRTTNVCIFNYFLSTIVCRI